MSAHCCAAPNHELGRDRSYRRVLWFALAVNALMFLIEMIAGFAAGSVALQADAIDFFADAGNYAVSLAVLGLALHWRARAALLKGASMGLFGVWVIGSAGWHLMRGTVPAAEIMIVVGFLALVANVGVAAVLYRYRGDDSNRLSVWLCSRNDAIANIAVLLAAAGVFGTSSGWPDLLVAAIIAGLGLSGAFRVIGHARNELRGNASLAAG